MTDTVDHAFWRGRRVFLTGHTGFKGAWLAAWLGHMGAEVSAFALAPAYARSPYELSNLRTRLSETLGDINDAATLHSAMVAANPQVVFHLAAQPLVRLSYRQPMETFRTNIMGTLNLLEGLASCPALEAVVIVTTDKCYRNQELEDGYTEEHPLGGYDPYSSSKACAELVSHSWHQSFLNGERSVGLATARAGNVIGGGDWSEDRLVPDVLRALERGSEPDIRKPHAIRPWQYVLDPLAGYLLLGQRLAGQPGGFSGPWNFGPRRADAKPVGYLVEALLQRLSPGTGWRYVAEPALHETALLFLDCGKAMQKLGWQPRFDLERSLDRVAAWYRCESEGADLDVFMQDEIMSYMETGAGDTA